MSVVYVVHSVDAEGPLSESVSETFKRIAQLIGPINIEPTQENLNALQVKKISLPNELSQRVLFDRAFSPSVLHYMRDLPQVDQMLTRVMSKEFRQSILDDFGQPWIYSWHCLDHLDYQENPRGRLMGMHLIYDYYSKKIKEMKCDDKIHWHFHPTHFLGKGHRSGTNYSQSKNLYQILAQRVIDRRYHQAEG